MLRKGCASKVGVLIFLLFCQFSLINQIVVFLRASPLYHFTYSNISPSVPGSTHQCSFAYIFIYIYLHAREDLGIPRWGFCCLIEPTTANRVPNIQRNITTKTFLYFISPTLKTGLISNVCFLSVDCAIKEDGLILFALVKTAVCSSPGT